MGWPAVGLGFDSRQEQEILFTVLITNVILVELISNLFRSEYISGAGFTQSVETRLPAG
jgi:hypothetical protein